MATLRDIFPTPADLLRLEPEEFGGVLMEYLPTMMPRGMFVWQNIFEKFYFPHGGGWTTHQTDVTMAIAEALEWLKREGLIIHDPSQSADWLRFTRRGQKLKTRSDVAAYRKAGVLPIQLLQPNLAEKVHHLFVRGDHDTAVFQAFKTLEVIVRDACGYGDEVHGKRVFLRAFKSDDGPLRNAAATQDEREAELSLFVGAVGHCRNPVGHRDVGLSTEEAARLIVFASHLLAIVEERKATLS